MSEKKEPKLIVIDERVARQIIHQINHMPNMVFVPEEVQNLKFRLTTGQEVSFRQMIESAKEKMNVIGKYLRAALEETP